VRPKNIYNEWGGTIGGPIWKNKLFFSSTPTASRAAVRQAAPTIQSSAHQWNFAGYLAGSTQAQIYDPASEVRHHCSPGLYLTPTTLCPTVLGKAVSAEKPLLPPNGSGLMQIPASRISSVAKKMLALLPAQTTASNTAWRRLPMTTSALR